MRPKKYFKLKRIKKICKKHKCKIELFGPNQKYMTIFGNPVNVENAIKEINQTFGGKNVGQTK